MVRQIDAQAAQPAQYFTSEQFLGFSRKQTQCAEIVHSCYEAGPFGYVLHRRLEALGVRSHSRGSGRECLGSGLALPS